jgi:isoprenylcysteine carboxyl methyltransferase (ICMT) family protein YpbQ
LDLTGHGVAVSAISDGQSLPVSADPNYAVVTAEIFVLPMASGQLGLALLFSSLNAAILGVRIRGEENALRGI